jgi:hypothetical protein
MAVTNYLSCGTCANDTGVGTLSWASDDDAGALVGNEVSSNNDVYAGVQLGSITTTYYLKCTNFGFTSSDIPSGATINGFEIEVRQFRASIPTVTSTEVKLVKGGTVSGNDFGASVDWDTTETAVVYGSSTQLGGLSWTQSDVTSSNFGCAISVTSSSTRTVSTIRSVLIDQVQIRVYYTSNSITGISSITGIASITC